MKTEHRDLSKHKAVDVGMSSGHSTQKARAKASATLNEFNQKLFQHPEMKQALIHLEQKMKSAAEVPAKRSRRKFDAKMPKLLRQAITKDERIGELTQAAGNVMKYHREVNKLLEEKANGQTRDHARDKAFVKKWSSVEKDYQTMVKGVCTVYRENPLLMASGKALAENPADLHVFANPAFLGKDEMAVAEYLGITTEEIGRYYEYSYLPNKDTIIQGLASEHFEKSIKFVEEAADQLPFRLSPQYLAQENVLEIGGDLFLFAGLFASLIAVVTAVVTVAVLATAAVVVANALGATQLAAAIAQSSAAVVQTVRATGGDIGIVLDNAGEWVSDQWHKEGDWLARQWEKARHYHPHVDTDLSLSQFLLTVDSVEKKSGETGSKYRITVSLTDEKGKPFNLKEATLIIMYTKEQSLSALNYVNLSPGLYTADWGPPYWTPAGPRIVQFSSMITYENGDVRPSNVVDVIAFSSNSNWFTQIQKQQVNSNWKSTTSTYTPEQTAQLFGYALGNMSRNKKELHLPNCSFLHLITPRHLRAFNSLEEGSAAGLDNCAHCIGDSKR